MSPGRRPRRKGRLPPKWRSAPTTIKAAPARSKTRPSSRAESMEGLYGKYQLRSRDILVAHPSGGMTTHNKKKSDEFEAGEEVADFECGSCRCVGAVGAIVADAGAEVVADCARRGFLRVGSAHGVTPLQDGAFCF